MPTVCCEDYRNGSSCLQIIAHKNHEIMFMMITGILLSYLTKVAFLQIGISFFKWGSPIEEIMVGIMVQVLEQIQYTNMYYFKLAFLQVCIFPRSRVQKLV